MRSVLSDATVCPQCSSLGARLATSFGPDVTHIVAVNRDELAILKELGCESVSELPKVAIVNDGWIKRCRKVSVLAHVLRPDGALTNGILQMARKVSEADFFVFPLHHRHWTDSSQEVEIVEKSVRAHS